MNTIPYPSGRRDNKVEPLDSCSVPLVSTLSVNSTSNKRVRCHSPRVELAVAPQIPCCCSLPPTAQKVFLRSGSSHSPPFVAPARFESAPQVHRHEQRTDRLFPSLRSFQRSLAGVDRYAILPTPTVATQRPGCPNNGVSALDRSWL